TPEVTLPHSHVTIELFREAATILMLIAVAMLAARAVRVPALSNDEASRRRPSAWSCGSPWRERWAVFLWCFAIWDATYYAGLWATIRWPNSLTATDVLFLIPVPWYAQVWFPLLIDAAVLIAILF